ncbi:MAG: aminoacyl-tRNA hydrolase [Bacteroidales bacterium]|nr:aminoacyl-tRNA hydrolase [Bacteroidales bacterium]
MRYLIVGLGNVGGEYAGTRHNIGFAAVEYFVQRHEGVFQSDRYAYSATFRHKNKQLTVLKPTTYMNLSGKAVRYHMEKLHIPMENLMVISDDKDLPLGQLRVKAQGSGGTHNGLNNIIELLHSSQFPRMRIGIGNDFPKGRQIDFVLGRFTEEECVALRPTLERCSEALLCFVDQGVQKCMNQFNTKGSR